MLPWAVPEVEPAAVAAIFVDEINGQVVGRQSSRRETTSTSPSWSG